MALLEVTGLHRVFKSRGHEVRALDGVDVTVAKGRTLAVVGESGSGKSTLGSIVAGLQPPSAGELRFDGTPLDVRRLRGPERRRIQMVFQSPLQSLNARYRVESTLTEPLRLLAGLDRRQASARVDELLAAVHLPAELRHRRPGELSGGQQQRVAIARALAADPDLIVLDEPTSGLDQSIRGRIVTLLRELQAERGLSYIFITHDIAVARACAHEVVVMQRGQIVERGGLEVLDAPQHPYTRTLLAAVPGMDPAAGRRRRASAAPDPSAALDPEPAPLEQDLEPEASSHNPHTEES
ncbi:ABC transporter ATP-binding protein [Pseudactinotalea suaedae]|uniref:ABC transporter ATP-binding protein n=1 Tax=Pseudactinotalea suaedae TaxID=1524924 RepID=UPI001F500D88|nr:ATP-binding cassette domain-containing protein [Pseudactinotalea suaedae]